MITTVTDRELALTAERDELRRECTAWATTAENLEAELERKQKDANFWKLAAETLEAERDALKAQEPIATVVFTAGGFWRKAHESELGVPGVAFPVFLAAGAAPAAQEPVATYIGSCPDGDLVQLHDDLVKGTKLFTASDAGLWLTKNKLAMHEVLHKGAPKEPQK